MAYILKSGTHFIHIEPGFGCAWATVCDEDRATEFETREAAEEAARRAHLKRFEVAEVGQEVQQ